MKRLKQESGFTLMELLITIGIICVVLGVTAVGVVQAKISTEQKRLDEYAEIIYTAAQSRLTDMRTTGRSAEYQPDENTIRTIKNAEPSDTTDEATLGEFTSGNMCYLKVQNADGISISNGNLAFELMPDDRTDQVLWNGNWVIEYNYRTGTAYSVFFTEASTEDDLLNEYKGEDGKILNDYRDKSNRRGEGIGYYGGGMSVAQVNAGVRLEPDVNVSNGAVLTADFTCPAPEGYTASQLKDFQFSYTIYELDDQGKKTGTYGSNTGIEGKYNTGTDLYEYTLILDNPLGWDEKTGTYKDTEKTSFGALSFSTKSGTLILGSNMLIEVYADAKTKADNMRIMSITGMDKFNNLFGDGTSDGEAEIIEPRHLQNLDKNTSNVDSSITSVQLKSDIQWPEDVQFNIIHNTCIKDFDGGNKDIKDLTDSLFNQFSGNEVKNLDLVDSKINNQVNDSNDGYAGALARCFTGQGTGNNASKITNVGTYLTNDNKPSVENNTWDDDDYIIKSKCQSAGGLIGKANGKGITMTNCYAATTIYGKNQSGGLIGQIYKATVTMTNCYSDSYVFGPNTGGLIGTVSGDSSSTGTGKIQSCYAAGYLYGTNVQGGLIALIKDTGKVEIAKPSYTVCEFMGKGTTKVTTIPKGNSSLYYLNKGNESTIVGTQITAENKTVETFAPIMNSGLEKAAFDTTAQLANTYNLLSQYSNWNADPKKSEPKNYQYPGIKDLPHYGDWGPLTKDDGTAWVNVSTVNAEKLTLNIEVGLPQDADISGQTLEYKIYQRDKTSVYRTISVNLDKIIKSDAATKSVGDMTYTVGKYTVVLDDLSANNKRFAGLTTSDILNTTVKDQDGKAVTGNVFSGFNYGCILKAVASVPGRTLASGSVDTKDYFSSLFSDKSGQSTAHIACGRHLQNLNQSISKVDDRYKNVEIDNDVDFGSGSSWQKTYGKMAFTPISNTNIIEIIGDEDGKEYTFKNLTINTSGNGGLFTQFGKTGTTVKINNLTLQSPVINASGDVGAFMGEGVGKLTMTNCKVIDGKITTSGDYAGGLIGKNSANTTLVSCSNRLTPKSDQTVDNPNVSSKNSAGGLVGITADNCNLNFEESFASVIVGDKDCANSGGLIGKTGTSEVTQDTPVESIKTVPVDFVLVLDQSGSMEYDYGDDDNMTRQDALKKAAIKFINEAAAVTCVNDNKHRISIVEFEDDASTIADFTILDEAGRQTLVNKISNLEEPGGGTDMDEGLGQALTNIQKRQTKTYTLKDKSTKERKTVVILFTDGAPGDEQASGDYFSEYYGTNEEADAAVAKASALKAAGATVFTIGAFEDASPAAIYTTTVKEKWYLFGGNCLTWRTRAQSSNGLMHFISSDYDSSCTSWTGYTTNNDGRNNGYFYNALSANALENAFDSILEDAAPRIYEATATYETKISNCYADCYCIGNSYAGGLAGWIGSIPAHFTNCYAAGYTFIKGSNTNAIQAGFAAGAAGEYSTFRNCYTIVRPDSRTNYAATINVKPSAAETAYYMMAGKLTTYGSAITQNASEFASALGSAFALPSTVKITPYNLNGQSLTKDKFTTPVLSGMNHYGDWGGLSDKVSADVSVKNGEKLMLNIDVFADNADGDTMTVNYTVYQDGNSTQYPGSCQVTLDGSGEGTASVALDDLSSTASQFKTKFPKLTAGADCNVKVTGITGYTLSSTPTATFNSLFASVSGDTAKISCGRHLQNLDTASSGVTGSITKAVLTGSIDFANTGADHWANTSVYGTKKFTPITNTNLVEFDGQNKSICDLTVETSGNAGLFASFGKDGDVSTQRTISRVNMVRPNIKCDGSAGAIAGITYGGNSGSEIALTMTECSVTDGIILSTGSSQNAGGLIGTNNAKAKLVSCCNILNEMRPEKDGSWFKTTNVYGSNASGGLVGYTKNASKIIFQKSYAAAVVGGKVNDTVCGYCGGLIGKAGASETVVTECYADCYLRGNYVGGLTGWIVGNCTMSFDSCYAAGYTYDHEKDAGIAVCQDSPKPTVKLSNTYTILEDLIHDNLNYATINIDASTVSNVYYWNRCSGKKVGKEITTTNSTKISNNYPLNDKFTWTGTTVRYKLGGQNLSDYPMPVLASIGVHYGDGRMK